MPFLKSFCCLVKRFSKPVVKEALLIKSYPEITSLNIYLKKNIKVAVKHSYPAQHQILWRYRFQKVPFSPSTRKHEKRRIQNVHAGERFRTKVAFLCQQFCRILVDGRPIRKFKRKRIRVDGVKTFLLHLIS